MAHNIRKLEQMSKNEKYFDVFRLFLARWIFFDFKFEKSVKFRVDWYIGRIFRPLERRLTAEMLDEFRLGKMCLFFEYH